MKFAKIRNNQCSRSLYPNKKVNFDNKLKESDLFANDISEINATLKRLIRF